MNTQKACKSFICISCADKNNLHSEQGHNDFAAGQCLYCNSNQILLLLPLSELKKHKMNSRKYISIKF